MNFNSTKIHKREYFNSFLKDGDNMQAIGDYSSEKTEFVLQNNKEKYMFISNMVIVIEENSGFKSNKYGNNIILKNGIKAYYIKNGEKHYIFGHEMSLKTNKDFLYYNCDIERKDFDSRHKFQKIKFEFSNNIVLSRDDKLVIELNDDFSNLEGQTFNVDGFYLKIK